MMGKQNYDIDHEGEDDREKNARIKGKVSREGG